MGGGFRKNPRAERQSNKAENITSGLITRTCMVNSINGINKYSFAYSSYSETDSILPVYFKYFASGFLEFLPTFRRFSMSFSPFSGLFMDLLRLYAYLNTLMPIST